MNLIKFAKKVKRLRRAQGLSAYNLASRSGINRSTVNRIEKGYSEKTNFPYDPHISTLMNLAHGLSVSMSDLVDTSRVR